MSTCRHARKYFVGLEDDQLHEVQRVMGLLAFPSNTTIAPYRVSNSCVGLLSIRHTTGNILTCQVKWWGNFINRQSAGTMHPRCKQGLNQFDSIGVQLVDIGSTTTMSIEPRMTLPHIE